MTQIQKLTGGLGLMAGAAVVWSFTSLSVISGLSNYLEASVGATTAGIDQLGQIDRAVSDMVGLERALVLHSMFGQVAEADKDRASFDTSAASLKKLVAALPPALVSGDGSQAAGTLKDGIASWNQLHGNLKAWLDKQQADEAEKMLRNDIQPVADRMQGASRRLSTSGTAFLQGGVRSASAKVQRSRWGAFAFILVFLVAAVGLLFEVRHAGRRLQQVSGQVSGTAGEVASAASKVAEVSRHLAESTSAQAASLEETSASSTEVEATSQKNATDTREVATVVAEVDRKVGDANRTLDQMVASMNEIRTSSEKIARIIKVVDEIAFQTNILALNAAVEAARAGEAGMGFAVVADEVRNLAQRSAQAARDTTGLIEESVVKARAGSERLDEVTRVIAGITADTGRVKSLVDQVEAASRQQAAGMRQIAEALNSMEQITQRSAADAQEGQTASQGLDSQVNSIRRVVEELSKVVG